MIKLMFFVYFTAIYCYILLLMLLFHREYLNNVKSFHFALLPE